jgi:hypothetical protein
LDLRAKFEELCKELDYYLEENNSKTTEVYKQLDMLLTLTISFAQFLASQRAIYELFGPPLCDGHRKVGPRKQIEDENWTNTTSGGNPLAEEEEEVAGWIGYLVIPALLMHGTDMGRKLDSQTIVLVKASVELGQEIPST